MIFIPLVLLKLPIIYFHCFLLTACLPLPFHSLHQAWTPWTIAYIPVLLWMVAHALCHSTIAILGPPAVCLLYVYTDPFGYCRGILPSEYSIKSCSFHSFVLLVLPRNPSRLPHWLSGGSFRTSLFYDAKIMKGPCISH